MPDLQAGAGTPDSDLPQVRGRVTCARHPCACHPSDVTHSMRQSHPCACHHMHPRISPSPSVSRSWLPLSGMHAWMSRAAARTNDATRLMPGVGRSSCGDVSPVTCTHNGAIDAHKTLAGRGKGRSTERATERVAKARRRGLSGVPGYPMCHDGTHP